MKVIEVIIAMIFCHIIADYNLQGWMASAKQKSWWEENAPDYMYRYDYLAALFMHSFGWSFLIMIPIFILSGFTVTPLMAVSFAINTAIHMFVDNLKANAHKINLIQDQACHIIQIVATALLFTI